MLLPPRPTAKIMMASKACKTAAATLMRHRLSNPSGEPQPTSGFVLGVVVFCVRRGAPSRLKLTRDWRPAIYGKTCLFIGVFF